MGKSQKTTQRTERNPYDPAVPGLELTSARLTDAAANATPYEGRFTPNVSDFTKTGLTGFGDLAGSINPAYGRNALNLGDYTYNKIMSGGYKPPTYDPTAAIDAATRPIFEKYGEQVLPNLSAFFTSNGGYQGGAPGGVSSTAGDVVARNLTREVAQAAGGQTLAAADLNSRNLLAGNQAEDLATGAVPGVYQGGVAAAGLLPQLFGQTGALDENIAGRSIMEALTRSNYDNSWESSVMLPILQALTGTGSAFGTDITTTTQKIDPVSQALGIAVPLASIAAAPFTGGASLMGLGLAGGGGQAMGIPNPFKSAGN